MFELRKDYLLNRWVVIAEKRGTRPKEYHRPKMELKGKVDFFAPGNEHLTPPEIYRVEKDGKWQIRVFPNKFPAAEKEGSAEVKTDNEFFTYSNSYGSHEVVVETPDINEQLWDLPVDRIKEVFKTYALRITDLYKEPTTDYVTVFKNSGGEAGTSLIHSHTQIVSVNIIPALIMDEINASKEGYFSKYSRVIEIEKKSDRRCFENEHFVAFTPYASRFNYEIWVFPKRFVKNPAELTEAEFGSLADVMKKILVKLKKLDSPYNYHLHISPKNDDLYFHIEVTPRMATWAGYELSTDIIINSISPETAAAFYRQ